MSEQQQTQNRDVTQNKISESSAKEVMQRMLDYYEIDIDEIEDEKLKEAINSGYTRAIKGIKLGRLQVKVENGIQIIQTKKSGDKITYREIDGNAKSQMDGHPAEAYYRRAYALLGSLSGDGEAAIKNLKGVDLSLAEVLGLLFLAV